ncbi:MAG: 1,4-alpha-glucan branching protein GlgB [Lachnospiraceae bacterium]|nr:1,4-alpha-glucan branching protein GlgB [Lachnospiraceae bacterium]
MSTKLYDLMNWADIEEITYSESENPHRILGRHTIDGVDLIQAYLPTASAACVKFPGKKPIEMELVDEESSWFAAEVKPSYKGVYTLSVTYGENIVEFCDPYEFGSMLKDEDIDKFEKGIHYEVYKVLGAHPMTVKGVEGTFFAVWAPNAIRCSIVGDFNSWDGTRLQMKKTRGIFELFVPSILEGDVYKFEIKAKGGLTYLKSDPYAYYSELRPNTASVVTDISHFQWDDEEWIKNRAKTQSPDSPISVYEVYLGSVARGENNEYLNYRVLADKLIDYVKDLGYTHVELMPVSEHPLDASWGYQVIGYYSPTSRYGRPEDFAAFVNKLHNAGIGVILDWVPAHFPRDTYGLSNFDGTCLYEHLDPRKGSHPHWGTLVYNYARPQVSNYLIANALYWIENYHVDGLRVDAVASMLYLDYGRKDGEWIPNIYGGKENLDAVEFFKHTNSIVHKRNPNTLMIAEESTAWPMVTGRLDEGGLGFDYKWNMGYMNDFIDYIKADPYFRSYEHNQLTFSMMYAYSEQYMLAFSHDEAVHGKGTMIGKMPGDEDQRFAALRITYAYMMMHPGKKLLFMGQDIGEYQEFSEQRAVNLDLLQYKYHLGVKTLMKDLNALYRSSKALNELDNHPDGFFWTNCISWQDCFVAFVRKGSTNDKALFVVANFSGVARDMTAGVPWAGKYKEILNTDAEKYGGGGNVNPRVKKAKKQEWDGQPYSINLKVAAQSAAIFEISPEPEEEKTKAAGKKEEKANLADVKKRAGKKAAQTEAGTDKPATYTKKSEPKKKKSAAK